MEPAKSAEERLTALEMFKEEVSKTTKVRFLGADKLSKRGLAYLLPGILEIEGGSV
jgi:hypothetical protein